MAKGILAKHTADGATSPLAGLDVADFTAKVSSADTENQSATKLRRDAEKATQNRDLALGGDSAPKGSVAFYVRSARDILLGLNKGSEQRLGDWSFEVDASAQSARKTPPPA